MRLFARLMIAIITVLWAIVRDKITLWKFRRGVIGFIEAQFEHRGTDAMVEKYIKSAEEARRGRC